MYGQQTFPRSFSEFLNDLLTSPDVMSSPLNFPLSLLSQLTVTKSVDSVSDALHSSSSSSESFNLSSLLASCCTQKPSFIRNFSIHSLPKNELHCRFASSLNEFIDSDSSPVRRVFSTGDLHPAQHSAPTVPRKRKIPNQKKSQELRQED